jgi:hypothetical protein
MFKIRIKNSPSDKKTGDQDEYGLVRNLSSMQNTSNEVRVNDKMGAVPRDKATIEVEGGESVIGDVNKDGNMELMHFVGKKHSQGGVPVDVPEGSFVFSDTKSLTIKDKEVLEKIFGLTYRKQGYTPGAISKNFDINKYIQILKDENADEIAKRTAAEMLKKNKEKLGILAFIQESMKGFPDGIPTIAEEVMAQMGVDPEQLMQEAQPEQPQEGQPQEGGNPMEGMSPEEQEMMMQMMQQQGGAPMGEGMPMQKYGGLTQYVEGGNNVSQALELQKVGYNADPLVNNQVQTKIPGVNMNPFIYNANYENIYDSLRNNPVEGFENSGFEQGKIYTFKSRPGSYYKIGEDGRLHIKNEGTGWQYKPMEDPEGKRRQVLEAGFDSGLTREFVKSKAKTKESSNPSQLGFPGGNNQIKQFVEDNPENRVAYDIYKKALDSKDPVQMMDAIEALKKTEDRTPWYSASWLPMSDEDKMQDMQDILRQEALKVLNEKEKKKITTSFRPEQVIQKMDDLISYYEKASQKEADVNKKLYAATQLEKIKDYKNTLTKNNLYKNWYNDTKQSRVVTSDDFLGTNLGNPITDKDLGFFIDENAPNKSIMNMLEYIDQKHAKIKNTKANTLAFKNMYETRINGGGDTISFGSSDNAFESDLNNINKVYNRMTDLSSQSSVSKEVNERVQLPDMPDYTYKVDNSKDALDRWGHPVYVRIDGNGGEETEHDPIIYQRLHNAFKAKGKTYAFSAPSDPSTVQETPQVVVQEPTAKEILRNAVVKPKATVSNQGSVQQPQQQVQPQGKYEGGLSDDDFNNLFKMYGGEMDMYEDGGVIDSYGHMIKLPKSYLQRFDDGGFVSQGKKTAKINNVDTEVEIFVKTFGDGTELQVVKDTTGKVISKRALPKGATNGISLRIDQDLYRGLTEKVTADNLTDEEKTYIKSKWGNNIDEYLKFQNTRAGLYRDPEVVKAISAQYKDIVNNQGNRYFTGKDDKTRNYFANLTDNDSKKSYSETLKSLTEEDMMQQLLSQEERNARLRALGYKAEEGDQEVAGFSNKAEYKRWKKDPRAYQLSGHTLNFIEANQDQLNDLDFKKGYQGQTAYLAYVKALLNDPRYKDKYKEFQSGKGDEGVLGLSSKISGSEGYSTNTTLGQFLGFEPIENPEQNKENEKETPQGKWYCVDGQVVQGTVDASGKETAPTGTKVEGPYNDKGSAEAVCKTKSTDFERKGPEYGGWFAPDIVNYGTALGQRTPFTLPSLDQMQAPPSGYDTLNPITHIASITGASKQYSDQLANTMDPTVAAAAASNFDFDALARGIAKVEIDNNTIANNAYDKIAARNMQVDQFNTGARRQYKADVATAIEERARDMNNKDAMLAKLYGQGWWNAARDEGNRARFPQAKHINRITGDFEFSGDGKDPLEPDTSGGYNNTADATTAANAEYQRVFDARKTAGDDDATAKTKAEAAMKQVYNDHNYYRSSKNRNQQDAYAGTFGGFNSPYQKYGGSLNFSAPDYDFFFGE